MRHFKDKLVILILLTALLQIYIMVSRGHWTTRIEQENSKLEDKNRLILSENLYIESEHLWGDDNKTIGTATYFVTNKCFTVDSLSISISEVKDSKEIGLKKIKTRVADLSELEFDSIGNLKEESLLKSEKVNICPGQRIEITNWFEYFDKEASVFRIRYFILTGDEEKISGKVNIFKKRSFEIIGRHHYDFIILLYPVLWIILGLLTLVKIVNLVRYK